MSMITLNERQLEMYYELHGDPKAPPMVLISGLKADHASWASMTAELAKDHYVLVFDNRGTGQTIDNADIFSVDTMADDTIALIKALDIENAFIVGHSLGGAIAQVIAKRYPSYVKATILANTFVKFNESAKAGFLEVIKYYERHASAADIMSHIVPWVFSDSFVNEEILALIRETSNKELYPQKAEGYRRQMEALCEFDSSSWVSDIKLPTLVIGSKEDITATVQESKVLHQYITDSEFGTLVGGHASAVEQPQDFLSLLRRFCRGENVAA